MAAECQSDGQPNNTQQNDPNRNTNTKMIFSIIILIRVILSRMTLCKIMVSMMVLSRRPHLTKLCSAEWHSAQPQCACTLYGILLWYWVSKKDTVTITVVLLNVVAPFKNKKVVRFQWEITLKPT